MTSWSTRSIRATWKMCSTWLTHVHRQAPCRYVHGKLHTFIHESAPTAHRHAHIFTHMLVRAHLSDLVSHSHVSDIVMAYIVMAYIFMATCLISFHTLMSRMRASSSAGRATRLQIGNVYTYAHRHLEKRRT